MGDVVTPSFNTRLDLPVERILDAPEARALEDVILMGWDKDGDFYMAGTMAELGRIGLLLMRAQRFVMDELD